jgi:hypothetical protein
LVLFLFEGIVTHGYPRYFCSGLYTCKPCPSHQFFSFILDYEESLSNNDLSIKTIFVIIYNMERKQQEQYDKIMGILGEYRENKLEIEMECYKIKCSIQYESDTYTLDIASSGQYTG